MIGLYALENNIEMAAFAEGLRAASLHYKYRNHNHFIPDQVEPFEMVVLTGLREKGAVVRDAYRKLSVPVVVIDYGYLKRVHGIRDFQTGHWQVGLWRLGWIPLKAPADRFEALGIDVKPKNDTGKYVLVCGQHAGDPMHGLTDLEIAAWAEKTITQIKEHTDIPVLWRPHPDSAHITVRNADGLHTGQIDWGDVYATVCINSNVGLESLINGIPVFCRVDAPYKELGNFNFAMINSPYFPGDQARLNYLHRAAYAQWTLDEMRQGMAINFIRSFT